MGHLTILFILCIFLGTHANAEYEPWVERQLALTHQMNEVNVTQEMVEKIAEEQHLLYNQSLEKILLNKKQLLNQFQKYDKNIFSLKKIIALNKRSGNEYAVIRDEVLLKSYRIIQLQEKMVKSIFHAADHYDIEKFSTEMYELFNQNQLEMQEINDIDYKPILKIDGPEKRLKEAQKNIKDYYALIEINADILRYFVEAQQKVYRLNKFSEYNLLGPVLYINHLDIVEKVNPLLSPYGLNVVKLLLIVFTSLILYIIRKGIYITIKIFFLKSKYLKEYATEILSDLERAVAYLFFIINIEMVIYIFNDFNSLPAIANVFNILYVLFFTFFIYKMLNDIALIRIQTIGQSEKEVKAEMINISIKIINFMIMIFGLLLVLHLVGVNLTTVLSGLGIGGLAVALAARESLSNFFGTISILMSDVYSQGDWIAVGDKDGIVVEIGLRVTTLRTFDNALIAIPNATLANQDVKNMSKRIIGRRIKLTLGVKYDSKAENINNAIEEIREMLKNHPDIASEKTMYQDRLQKSAKLVSKEDELGVKRTLMVYLDEFSESSITILVYCFTKTIKWNEWLQTKEDVMYKIMDILERNSLEFAFPSISLYHEKDDSKS